MKQHLKKLILFGLIGSSGIFVNTGFLYLFHDVAGLVIPIASAFATEIAIISNFFGNHFITFRGTKNKNPLWQKFLTFQAVSVAALVVTVGVLTSLVFLFGAEFYLLWNLVAIGAAFIINFLLNLKYTWSESTA